MLCDNDMSQPYHSKEMNKEYNMNYSSKRQHDTKKFLDIIGEELIARTWHPDRVFDWCGINRHF
jgi:hypothetical protein